MVKVWLDDVVPPPNDSWYWAKTIKEVQDLLILGEVDFVSLDHDLGLDQPTGYDLCKWMADKNLWPSKGLAIHSRNPVGVDNMKSVVARYGPYAHREVHSPQPRFWI